MRTLTYQLRDLKKAVICIGFEDENNRTQVKIDCAEVFAEYPNAAVTMKVQAPKGGIYPATVTRDGDMILWTVRDCDVANKGSGEFQMTFTDGTTVVKTCVGKFHVDRSLKGSGTAPSGVQDWLDHAEDVLEQVESAEIHQPMIGLDGYWYKWDQEAGEYVSTGTKAQGQDGQPGQDGQDGTDATPDLITKDYADLTFPVAKDSFCYHDGKLYQAKQAIQTAEDWTAAHWQETTVEEKITDIKNAFLSISEDVDNLNEDIYGDYQEYTVTTVNNLNHKSTTTAYETSGSYRTYYFPCTLGIKYKISCKRKSNNTTNIRLCIGANVPSGGVAADFVETIACDQAVKVTEYTATLTGYIGLSCYYDSTDGIETVEVTSGKQGLFDEIAPKNFNQKDLWQEGYYGATEGAYTQSPSNPFCCMINSISKAVKEIKCPSSYKMRVHAWKENGAYMGTWTGTTFSPVSGANIHYYTDVMMADMWAISQVYSLKIVLVNATDPSTTVTLDDTQVVELIADVFDVAEAINQTSLEITKINNRLAIGSDFVIDANFLKRGINVTEIGQISGPQSFCFYNNKYYSLSNGYIYRQSASFADEANTALNIGHGNALVLGSNGVAYASGWDDDTVYVVDLETMTVTDSIALPITGYTTCAVDDVNEIMYIFSRSDTTSTVDNWTFTVWDYGNDNVLLTKKITNAFAAIQDVDFYNGRILVAWGLGSVAAPSGMAVYDTNGNMLTEYRAYTIRANEPEGVCFDREGNRLLFSTITQKVFQIEQKV